MKNSSIFSKKTSYMVAGFISLSALVGLCFLTALPAYSEPTTTIRSLTPEEAAAQTSPVNNGRSVEGNNVNSPQAMQPQQPTPAEPQTQTPISTPAPTAAANAPIFTEDTGFMTKFCADHSTIKACKETQRAEACTRFKNASVDVQKLMDRTVSCDAKAQSGLEGDCDGLDAGRLDLLKQYWQDEDMSYTILFLPDMVLSATTNCPITQDKK